jgi:hypothetical protein
LELVTPLAMDNVEEDAREDVKDLVQNLVLVLVQVDVEEDAQAALIHVQVNAKKVVHIHVLLLVVIHVVETVIHNVTVQQLIIKRRLYNL